MQINIRPTGSAILATALVALAAWHWKPWQDTQPGNSNGTVVQTPEPPINIETNGGDLNVATLQAKERFTKTTSKTIFGVEMPLGRTTSHFQAQVTYRYHIEMAKKWPVEVFGNAYIVRSPNIKPTLPVAFDSATVERYTENGWARFDKDENLSELESTITGQLQNRAMSPQYQEMVKDAARVTVKAFTSTWLVSTHHWGSDPRYHVIVLFPGESLKDAQARDGRDQQ